LPRTRRYSDVPGLSGPVGRYTVSREDDTEGSRPTPTTVNVDGECP